MVTKIIYKYRSNNPDIIPYGKKFLRIIDFVQRNSMFVYLFFFCVQFEIMLSQQRHETDRKKFNLNLFEHKEMETDREKLIDKDINKKLINKMLTTLT